MAKVKIGKLEFIHISKLHPSSYNPRKISPGEFKKLKMSIRNFGFVEPIVVQKNGLNIIGGHQRVRALIDICKEDGAEVPKVPCSILAISDRKAKLLNIALNNIGGEFRQDMLSELIKDINRESELTPDDIESVGYEVIEVEKLLTAADRMLDTTEEQDLKPFASSITLSVKFDSVEERDTVKAILAERSAQENVKAGSILHKLLISE